MGACGENPSLSDGEGAVATFQLFFRVRWKAWRISSSWAAAWPASARRPDGAFVFARQYKKCIEQAYIEIPAGCMEVGEAPDVAAERELREESGYAVKSLLPLGSIYACPGYSEEQLHLFFAEVEAAPGATDFDPDENVETLLFDKETVERLILDGTISDAKTLSAWLFARLRSCI